ncbi:MAG: UdgX family uracil-DNA binding protein [Acidobacteriota bacterium]
MLRRVPFEPTFDDWRLRARDLITSGIPHDAVEWVPENGEHQGSLFAVADAPPPSAPSLAQDSQPPPPAQTTPIRAPPIRAPRVPASFPPLAKEVAYHRDPRRWSLLYRVLWRLTRGGERRLLSIDVDPDVAQMRSMEKAVRRDAHKMKAFVRFRRVQGDDGEPWFIAWHRPDHGIVPKVAPFFVERFNDQRWMILTPEASASWDLQSLDFGPGVPRHEAPAADALEDLWRTYYRSIFNPARLKVRAMKAELPVRHWGTLPEAELIPELIRSARGRTNSMLEPGGHPPARTFLPRSDALEALSGALGGCRACPLCDAGQPVFGEGPENAPLVLVGEQPGDVEERAGRPFVGPAGRILDAALDAVGLDRETLYLTNTVKHFAHHIRPDPRSARGVRRIHRTPSETEVSACFPWLDAELRRIRPPLLVCLGATASRAVIGRHVRLKRDRGRPVASPYAPFTLATYHPAAVLRVPGAAARADLEASLRADLALAAEALRAHRQHAD